MVSTAADSLGEISKNTKKESGLLKKLMTSQHKDNRNLLHDINDLNAKEKKVSDKLTKNNAVNFSGKSVLNGLFFTIPLFMIYIVLLVFLFPYVFENINNLTYAFFDLIQLTGDVVLMTWIATSINIWIGIVIFIYLLPGPSINDKHGYAFKSLEFLFIVVVGIVVWAFFMFSTFTPTEQVAFTTQAVSTGLSSTWEDFTCNLDYACVQKRYNEQNSVEAPVSTFDLKLDKSTGGIYTIDRLLGDFPPRTTYILKNSDEINLLKFECYYNIKDDDHKFTEIEFDETIEESLIERSYNGAQCDFSKLPLNTLMEKSQIDVVIIPVLTYDVDTQFTIKVPVVSQTQYFNEYTSEANEEDLRHRDQRTVDLMNSEGMGPEVIASNGALKMTASNIKNNFPLVYGNSEDYVVSLPIEITANNVNSFGKLQSVEFIDNFIVPDKFMNLKTDSDPTFIENKNSKLFSHIVDIEEIDSADNLLDSPIKQTAIEFSVKSVFEKDDTSTRFSVTINDPEWTAEKYKQGSEENESESYEYGDSIFDTEIDTTKYDSLSNRIEDIVANYNTLFEANEELASGIDQEIMALRDLQTETSNAMDDNDVTTFNSKLASLEGEIETLEDLIKEKLEEAEIEREE